MLQNNYIQNIINIVFEI